MSGNKNWGKRPWTVEFRATPRGLPAAVDFAVVGGGFTGLAAAAWLKRLAPEKSVALFEAGQFGSGSSGYTGGVALAESAAGELPGLGDVLGGYQKILRELEVDGEISLPGAYELGRSAPLANTPIRWKDSGDLCAVKEVPGGTINPGKVLSGLARAAERAERDAVRGLRRGGRGVCRPSGATNEKRRGAGRKNPVRNECICARNERTAGESGIGIYARGGDSSPCRTRSYERLGWRRGNRFTRWTCHTCGDGCWPEMRWFSGADWCSCKIGVN